MLQVDGESIIAPISKIDADKVELACNDFGCALIPDDGNPLNDIRVDIPGYEEHSHSHALDSFNTHDIELN